MKWCKLYNPGMDEDWQTPRRRSRVKLFFRWIPRTYGHAWLVGLLIAIFAVISTVVADRYIDPEIRIPGGWLVLDLASWTLVQGLVQSIEVRRHRRMARAAWLGVTEGKQH
jgi:hypothetical protein